MASKQNKWFCRRTGMDRSQERSRNTICSSKEKSESRGPVRDVGQNIENR
jgi:hypothetical protein